MNSSHINEKIHNSQHEPLLYLPMVHIEKYIYYQSYAILSKESLPNY